jgi:hypothetical protein
MQLVGQMWAVSGGEYRYADSFRCSAARGLGLSGGLLKADSQVFVLGFCGAEDFAL